MGSLKTGFFVFVEATDEKTTRIVKIETKEIATIEYL